MAAFGISFPKLTLSRPSIPKTDTNIVPSSSTPTNNTRNLSLSIKNVPSQPLHYDVSSTTTTTATVKKKLISTPTMLAIDGETKQLPKNLSVFNELQLDEEAEDINEKRKRTKNSTNVAVSSLFSSTRTIDDRPDIRLLPSIDSKQILHESIDQEKQISQERRSNHTFTPPTSSLSNDSLSDDLHVTLSSFSVDLPQLKYAIEKFLVDDNNPVYEVAEEFSTDCSHSHQDCHETNNHNSHVTMSALQHDQIDNTELYSMHKNDVNNEIPTDSSHMSNSFKWYVSELRINRPLIYRTQCINRQETIKNRKLSHSVNDLMHIYNVKKHSEIGKYKIISKKTDDIAYSTLSLQNIHNQQIYSQSNDNIILNNYLSCTDDDFNISNSNENIKQISPLIIQRTLNRSLSRDDTLIRNESVKKKLFDILNDDELENACIEDMSLEFEKMTITHHHRRDLPIINSFSSSSDDEAIYSSPPNELHLPPPLSSSYNENLSTHTNNTTECYLGRSRLITTSLDKIPMNNNAYDHLSPSYILRPSYESTQPSWYTSPSPQWRTDDQLPMTSILKRHSLKNDSYLNGTDNINHNQLVTDYDIKENRFIPKYNHHRKEPKHVSYSLMNTSTPLVDDSTPMLPIIQDKSPNLLMFI
ncbi:unnamed protein product [Adineta steineri]|uniref:Uncharacterized protein n=1 Tax=Adineta steineri TaxID=433720 RepID=A0A813MRL2_9BILA|nr:unnamed protein product [Adineta steineri]CAF3479797.1 unnamed protein product [Adineta steineri]